MLFGAAVTHSGPTVVATDSVVADDVAAAAS
jgi:hypothetical protein